MQQCPHLGVSARDADFSRVWVVGVLIGGADFQVRVYFCGRRGIFAKKERRRVEVAEEERCEGSAAVGIVWEELLVEGCKESRARTIAMWHW